MYYCHHHPRETYNLRLGLREVEFGCFIFGTSDSKFSPSGTSEILADITNGFGVPKVNSNEEAIKSDIRSRGLWETNEAEVTSPGQLARDLEE